MTQPSVVVYALLAFSGVITLADATLDGLARAERVGTLGVLCWMVWYFKQQLETKEKRIEVKDNENLIVLRQLAEGMAMVTAGLRDIRHSNNEVVREVRLCQLARKGDTEAIRNELGKTDETPPK